MGEGYLAHQLRNGVIGFEASGSDMFQVNENLFAVLTLLCGEVAHSGSVLYLAAGMDAELPLEQFPNGLFQELAGFGYDDAESIAYSLFQTHSPLLINR